MALRLYGIMGLVLGAALFAGGCGLVYEAGARVKTNQMLGSLKAGQRAIDIRHSWGEPDLRTDADPHTQIWSYASQPNSNDVAATIFYTSTKPGDTGTFLDLKISDGKLVSWGEAEHTVPAKAGTGFSYGLGGSGAPIGHY
jgi:hypothetical protein